MARYSPTVNSMMTISRQAMSRMSRVCPSGVRVSPQIDGHVFGDFALAHPSNLASSRTRIALNMWCGSVAKSMPSSSQAVWMWDCVSRLAKREIGSLCEGPQGRLESGQWCVGRRHRDQPRPNDSVTRRSVEDLDVGITLALEGSMTKAVTLPQTDYSRCPPVSLDRVRTQLRKNTTEVPFDPECLLRKVPESHSD